MTRINKTFFRIFCLLFLIGAFGIVQYYIWGNAFITEFQADCTDTLFWADASLKSGSLFDPEFDYAYRLAFGGQWLFMPFLKVFGIGIKALRCGMCLQIEQHQCCAEDAPVNRGHRVLVIFRLKIILPCCGNAESNIAARYPAPVRRISHHGAMPCITRSLRYHYSTKTNRMQYPFARCRAIITEQTTQSGGDISGKMW